MQMSLSSLAESAVKQGGTWYRDREREGTSWHNVTVWHSGGVAEPWHH